jgi:RNA polymerase subunit RPABC4/transcription elongation factor Spt4
MEGSEVNRAKRTPPSKGTIIGATMEKKSQFICPFCGALVPAGAPACPECGSDETTGWSDDILGLRSENPDEANPKKNNHWTRYLYVLVVVLIILGFLQFSLRGFVLLAIIIGIACLMMILAVLHRRMGHAGGSGKSDYAVLLSKARGDKELVRRLIEYEKQRNPFRTHKDLIKDALERWENDAR